MGKRNFIYTKDGSKKLIEPLRERKQKWAKIGGNENPITAACLKWTALATELELNNGRLFEMTLTFKER